MTVWAALLVKTGWVAKIRLEADSSTGATPNPLNWAACGEFAASSFTVRVPVRAPVAVGVNVTEIVQLDFAARVFGENGQVDVCAKSPDAEIPEMVSGAVWLLNNVPLITRLVVFTNWLPNLREATDNVAGNTPTPLSWAVCGEFEASSLTVRVPERTPNAVGVKVTQILQLAPAASLFGAFGQPAVSAKSPDTEMLLMASGTVRVLMRVTSLGVLAVCTTVFANGALVGLKV